MGATAEALSPAIPQEVEALAVAVLKAACAQDLRLVTAESCTGGLLASLLTDVPGCSHAFERGFVVYTDAAKTEMLGVPPELLAAQGAVSAAVARAMAEGALARSGGDIALSITGYAGPAEAGGEDGLVFFARAARGRATQVAETHFGPVGRGPVRLGCLARALEMMRTALAGAG